MVTIITTVTDLRQWVDDHLGWYSDATERQDDIDHIMTIIQARRRAVGLTYGEDWADFLANLPLLTDLLD